MIEIQVEISISRNGDTIVKADDWKRHLNLSKETENLDEYSLQYVSLNVLRLMKLGMGRYGIIEYIHGRLDRKIKLQQYCNRALLPYKDIADIIKPI